MGQPAMLSGKVNRGGWVNILGGDIPHLLMDLCRQQEAILQDLVRDLPLEYDFLFSESQAEVISGKQEGEDPSLISLCFRVMQYKGQTEIYVVKPDLPGIGGWIWSWRIVLWPNVNWSVTCHCFGGLWIVEVSILPHLLLIYL